MRKIPNATPSNLCLPQESPGRRAASDARIWPNLAILARDGRCNCHRPPTPPFAFDAEGIDEIKKRSTITSFVMRIFGFSDLSDLNLVTTFMLAIVGCSLNATADDLKNFVAITVEDAAQDPDFSIQGEYEGELEGEKGKQKWGLQVSAAGGGKFYLAAYCGGLPGGDWDKNRCAYARNVNIATDKDFLLEGGIAVIGSYGRMKNGIATIKGPHGELLGEMKRVERASSTLNKKAPEGAIVLFDGKNADAFVEPRKFIDGLLSQGVTSKQNFQDFSLHLEFVLPYVPLRTANTRAISVDANSGCYFQARYELQIFDSFGYGSSVVGCGSIYNFAAPSVNMCFPPLQWQTYDVEFTAAKFDDGRKVQNAKITVLHNGVLIHENVEIPGATEVSPLQEDLEPGPIYLQDLRRGAPVYFRNIWLVERKSDRTVGNSTKDPVPGDPRVAEVIGYLDDPDRSFRAKVNLLSQIDFSQADFEPAIPAILGVLANVKTEVDQGAVIRSLQRIGAPAVPALARLAVDKKHGFMSLRSISAMELAAKDAAPAVLKAALLPVDKSAPPEGTNSPQYQELAVKAIRLIGVEGKDALSVYLKIISMPYPEELPSRDNKGLDSVVCRNSFNDCVQESLEGIAEMGPEAKEALPILAALLSSTDLRNFQHTYKALIFAIGSMGAEAKSTIPALRAIRDLNGEFFGDEIDAAIDKIKMQ